jgi:hypothetical protein
MAPSLTSRQPATALARTLEAGKLVAQLDNVPSHNHRYRATLIPELSGTDLSISWRLRVESLSAELSPRPQVAMTSWMPERQSVTGAQPEATYLGHGNFRVDGLRFSEPGWWNVSVVVRDTGITDSLAFNLMVP